MKYLLFFFLIFCQAVWAKEELLVIQTVSVDQKSFVIAKGIKDGISIGQKYIFANDNISLVCKVIEVNRDYSYWYPVSENMAVPFLREEIVSFNAYVYGSSGMQLGTDQQDINQNQPAETIENKVSENIYDNKNIKSYRTSNHFSVRASAGAGLSQSASSVSAGQTANRYVYDASIEYDIRLRPEFEIGFGGRLDRDNYRIASASLDVPSTRMMAIAIITYHFVRWSTNNNNTYLSLVGGIGTSSTVVNQTTNAGMATLLPQVRLGYIKPYARKAAMIFELSLEAISANETLPDSSIQMTSSSNLKASIGISF
jgi:hypothetical protein